MGEIFEWNYRPKSQGRDEEEAEEQEEGQGGVMEIESRRHLVEGGGASLMGMVDLDRGMVRDQDPCRWLDLEG